LRVLTFLFFMNISLRTWKQADVSRFSDIFNNLIFLFLLTDLSNNLYFLASSVSYDSAAAYNFLSVVFFSRAVKNSPGTASMERMLVIFKFSSSMLGIESTYSIDLTLSMKVLLLKESFFSSLKLLMFVIIVWMSMSYKFKFTNNSCYILEFFIKERPIRMVRSEFRQLLYWDMFKHELNSTSSSMLTTFLYRWILFGMCKY
jgi:hypothetical protein